jgi:hypothetical protein
MSFSDGWPTATKTDWHDDVVLVAVFAKRAGIAGALHDMVIMHYINGAAVPSNGRGWKPRVIRSELRRIAACPSPELADLAQKTLWKVPLFPFF